MCRGHQFNELTQPQRGDMYIGYQKPRGVLTFDSPWVGLSRDCET